MKRHKILSCILVLFLAFSANSLRAFAGSDTSDGNDEIFYEWVEEYHHDSLTAEYHFDLGTGPFYIDYCNDNCSQYTSDIVEGLASTITSRNGNWSVREAYCNGSVWEADWSYLQNASQYIEQSDIAIFGGHGQPEGFQLSGLYQDPYVTPNDVYFGRNDLDWVFLLTCNWFNHMDNVNLHRILGGAFGVYGYSTTMYMDSQMGNYLGRLLIAGCSINDSWFEMNRVYPGPRTTPSNPTTAVAYNLPGHEADHIWDLGTVSSVRGTINDYDPVIQNSTITSPPPWWDGERI